MKKETFYFCKNLKKNKTSEIPRAEETSAKRKGRRK